MNFKIDDFRNFFCMIKKNLKTQSYIFKITHN